MNNTTTYIHAMRGQTRALRAIVTKLAYVNGYTKLVEELESIADSVDYYIDKAVETYDEEMLQGLKAVQADVGSTLKVLLDQKRNEG